MLRGLFTTAMVGITVALLVVALVVGITQRDPASVATAAPAGTESDGSADTAETDDPAVEPAPETESVDTPAVDVPPAVDVLPAPEDPAPDDPAPDDPAPDDPAPDDPAPDDSGEPDAAPDQLAQLSVVTSFGGITEAGGEVRFEITVTNQGTTPVAVEESHIQLVGPDGPLESVAGPDRGFETVELGPRESANGAIVFDVPPGSQGLILRVAPPGGQPVEIRL